MVTREGWGVARYVPDAGNHVYDQGTFKTSHGFAPGGGAFFSCLQW